MLLENLLALLQRRQVDHDVTVEATGTQQSLIEYIGSIGRGQHKDSLTRAHAIHFHQQLVECLFTFAGSSVKRSSSLRSLSTNSVDFIDVNDTRRSLTGFLEQVPDCD